MKALLDGLSFEVIEQGAFLGFLFVALLLVAIFIVTGIFQQQRFRYSLVLANTFILSLITAIRCQTDDALADMIWHAQLSIDFVLLPILPVIGWLGAPFHSRIVLPFLIFLILGGLQYFLIGRALDFIWGKMAARYISRN